MPDQGFGWAKAQGQRAAHWVAAEDRSEDGSRAPSWRGSSGDEVSAYLCRSGTDSDSPCCQPTIPLAYVLVLHRGRTHQQA